MWSPPFSTIRSPGFASFRESTFWPSIFCSCTSLGIVTPSFENAACTSPEQSMPLFDSPPSTYGTPL